MLLNNSFQVTCIYASKEKCIDDTIIRADFK
jgi:hypothetical protein